MRMSRLPQAEYKYLIALGPRSPSAVTAIAGVVNCSQIGRVAVAIALPSTADDDQILKMASSSMEGIARIGKTQIYNLPGSCGPNGIGESP